MLQGVDSNYPIRQLPVQPATLEEAPPQFPLSRGRQFNSI